MTRHDPSTLPFYTAPATITSAGQYSSLFDPLPHDIEALTGIVQGLLIHEHIAGAYGVSLTDEDRASVHIRRVEQLLAEIVRRDDRPLGTARAAADRVAGNCRHFTVLLVAILRAQGTPARARCGFGGYFVDGIFEDHWVGEYWHAGDERWILVDAQLDATTRHVPDRFRYHRRAPRPFPHRRRCLGPMPRRRRGPGGVRTQLAGRGRLLVDRGQSHAGRRRVDNIELLPWDCWGAMPAPAEQIDDDLAGLFDHLAGLTRTPDTTLTELRQLCQDDERLRVPRAVHNALRKRDEDI